MGQREREIAPTTDPAVVLARLRHALATIAQDAEDTSDHAYDQLPTVCRIEHEHPDDGEDAETDPCELEAEPVTYSDAEWDTIHETSAHHARALRELLARPDLQPPPGTTREA